MLRSIINTVLSSIWDLTEEDEETASLPSEGSTNPEVSIDCLPETDIGRGLSSTSTTGFSNRREYSLHLKKKIYDHRNKGTNEDDAQDRDNQFNKDFRERLRRFAFPAESTVTNEMWRQSRVDSETATKYAAAQHPGPSQEKFRLYLGDAATAGHPWNKKCCHIFLLHFLKDLDPETREQCWGTSQQRFIRTFDYINRHCRHFEKSEAEKELLKKANRENVARFKRLERRLQLTKPSGLLGQHPSAAKLRCTLILMGAQGMSDSEEDEDGVDAIIITPSWRSSDLNSLLRALDSVEETAMRGKGARQARDGHSLHRREIRRVSSRTASKDVPKGLHPNAYDPGFLGCLSDVERQLLAMDVTQHDLQIEDNLFSE